MLDGTLLARDPKTHIGFQGLHRRLLRSTPEGEGEAQQQRPRALAHGVYFYFPSFCPGRKCKSDVRSMKSP